MNKWLMTRLFGILTLLMQGQISAAVVHGQHEQHSGTGSVCGDPAAMPSIDCGLAPSATFDQRGRLWLAWAYGGHVYVNYSDDLGQRYSTPVAVNQIPETVSAQGENRPKIVIDGRGGAHVSWTVALPQKYSGNIRYSYSAAGGSHFSEPLTVNDNHELIGHRFEALAVSDDGHVYMAWLDKRDRQAREKEGGQYNGSALYYSHKAPGRDSFSRNIKIVDNSCECCRVAIELDGNDLPVVMWRHVYGDNIRDHSLVRFTGTEQFSKPVRVSHDNWEIDACPHHGPALAIDTLGRYHSVWFNDGDQRNGLFYAYSSDQGASFSSPISVGAYDRQAAHPDVLSIDDKVYLSWKEFDGESTQILLMRSDNNGRDWTIPQVVAVTNNRSDYPFLIQQGKQVFISWQTTAKGYQLIAVDEIDGAHNHAH